MAQALKRAPIWIFGYGSLIWHPGFEFVEKQTATLAGYRRSFCMRSIHHRGTVENPGLVLALDEAPQASCCGVAFKVKAGKAEETIAYLRERELISSAYLEKELTVTLRDGVQVTAVTYVIDEAHDQYCGGLALQTQADIIAKAVGDRGPNCEYLHNTAAHLEQIGIADNDLNWLSKQVKSLKGSR